MIDFETWWNSSSADEFRRLNDDMDGRVVRPVWDAAIRATLSSQKATSAAPSPEATQPTQAEDPCYMCGAARDDHPWEADPRGGRRRGACPDGPQPTQAEAPSGYAKTVIEALYENGDPVSVDAAELLKTLTAQQAEAPSERHCEYTDGTCKRDDCAQTCQAEILRHEARAALATQQAVQGEPVLPRPGSPEASAMIDSLLAEYQWPSNPKNAARAGFEAARRMLATPPAPGQVERDREDASRDSV